MLEKECDAILTVLKENSSDGFSLYQAKREFLKGIGITYKKLRSVLLILETDEMVRKAGIFHYINEIGINRLKNGGYSLLLTCNLNGELGQDEETNNTNLSNKTVKLKWLGSVAQFGYIIQQLIDKGYLARPTGAYKRDAEVYLELFEINTTPSTLSKEISNWEEQNSFSDTNKEKFKIPHIVELK